MKYKGLLLLLVGLMSFGCSKDTSNKEISYLEMSTEAKQYYDYYQTANSDAYFFPGETFNGWLDYLIDRGSEPQTMPETVEVTHTPTVSQVDGENVYTFSNNDYDKIVMYLHGGAYVQEADPTHYKYCDGLVDAINAKVVMPLYPLAPQHTFEDAHSMVSKIYNDLLEENKPMYIMGDSAGGGFTLAFTEYLIANNIKAPEKIVMFSPWLDVTMTNSELEDYEEADKTLSVYGCKILGQMWAGTTDLKDYRISPMYGNLDNLPDMMVFVATDEIMYPEVMKLYNNLTNTNIKVVVGNGFFHVFPIYSIPEKQTSYDLIKNNL